MRDGFYIYGRMKGNETRKRRSNVTVYLSLARLERMYMSMKWIAMSLPYDRHDKKNKDIRNRNEWKTTIGHRSKTDPGYVYGNKRQGCRATYAHESYMRINKRT